MPPVEADTAYQGCLAFCELHSRSLAVGCTGVQAHAILRLCTRGNYAISRLRKFSDCVEHICSKIFRYDCEGGTLCYEFSPLQAELGPYVME